MIKIIAAIAQDGALGLDNQLLYRMPNDMKRFKALTTGNTIIMGRKTFESFPKGALPNRRNIVLSRTTKELPGAECFTSIDEALKACSTDELIYIIGGASIYEQALPLADELCITHIENTPSKADAFFPPIDKSIWKEKSREAHPADEKHLYPYSFVDYVRAEQ